MKYLSPVESRHGVHHEAEVPDGAALLEERDQLVLVEVPRDLPAEHFTAVARGVATLPVCMGKNHS